MSGLLSVRANDGFLAQNKTEIGQAKAIWQHWWQSQPVADLCDLVERGVGANAEVGAGHVVRDGRRQHHLAAVLWTK